MSDDNRRLAVDFLGCLAEKLVKCYDRFYRPSNSLSDFIINCLFEKSDIDSSQPNLYIDPICLNISNANKFEVKMWWLNNKLTWFYTKRTFIFIVQQTRHFANSYHSMPCY